MTAWASSPSVMTTSDLTKARAGRPRKAPTSSMVRAPGVWTSPGGGSLGGAEAAPPSPAASVVASPSSSSGPATASSTLAA